MVQVISRGRVWDVQSLCKSGGNRAANELAKKQQAKRKDVEH